MRFTFMIFYMYMFILYKFYLTYMFRITHMSGWVKGGDHWGETGQNPHFKRPFHFSCRVLI